MLLPVLMASVVAATPSSAVKPHILMVLIDDLGWGNVGFHAETPSKEFPTPNMKALVDEGVSLERAYSYKFCSPSRCSLLSGRLPLHVSESNQRAPTSNPQDPVSGFQGIPTRMTTLGTLLKNSGYITAMVGKWDAGFASKGQVPAGRDFMTSLTYFHHMNDYWDETVRGGSGCGGGIDLYQDEEPAYNLTGCKDQNSYCYEENLFARTTTNIVANHPTGPSGAADAEHPPLFLYYAPHLVHAPLEVPDYWMEQFSWMTNDSPTKDRQTYAAMVAYFDSELGNLTALLKSKHMWNTTLLVAQSDNGGPIYAGGGANNAPLRGGKLHDFEGGFRATAFVTGGFLPANVRGTTLAGASSYIHLADWYATFAAIVGADPTDAAAAAAKLPPIDSMNMWPLISGINTTSPRTVLPLSSDTLISRQYKLIGGGQGEAIWTGSIYPNASSNYTYNEAVSVKNEQLFDIIADPYEHVNLADNANYSAILAELQGQLKSFAATAFNPNRGKKTDPAACTWKAAHKNFWGPWLA